MHDSERTGLLEMSAFLVSGDWQCQHGNMAGFLIAGAMIPA